MNKPVVDLYGNCSMWLTAWTMEQLTAKLNHEVSRLLFNELYVTSVSDPFRLNSGGWGYAVKYRKRREEEEWNHSTRPPLQWS